MSRRTAIKGLKTSFRFVLLEQHQGAQRSRGCLSPRSKYYVLSPLIAVHLDVAQGVCSESELLVCQYVRSALALWMPAEGICQKKCPDRNLEQREPFWKKIGKREKSWSRFKAGPPAFAYGYQLPLSKRYWVQSKRFECQLPFSKNTGFKAGALNAQLPFSKRYWVESGRFECPTPMYGISCKESESTLSQGIRTWKDCDRGESDSSTRAVRQKVWNGSETALKIECPVPIYSTMSQKTWKQSGRRSREQPGSTQKERFKWNWNDFITPSRDPK